MNFKDLISPSTSGHEPMALPAQKVRQALQGNNAITTNAAKAVVSMESRAQVQGAELENLHALSGDIGTFLGEIRDRLVSAKPNKEGKLPFGTMTHESRAAAAMTGLMMASDASMGALRAQTLKAAPTGNDTVVVSFEGKGGFDTRQYMVTTEAFKNYDLDNSRIFSTLFNYSIVDFDDYIRTFWRPVTMSPDSSFVELLINVLTVFNGYEHRIDGEHRDWMRHNLVRAIADHTILHTNLTEAIPVVRPESVKFFMDAAIVPPTDIMQAGDLPVSTAPLKFGVENASLISLASPGWLIKTGALDQRDGLDPGVKMARVVIALANDVLSFDVKGLPGSEFNEAPQGDRQLIQLNWVTTSFKVNKDTKNADGSALSDLAIVVTGEYELRIKMNIQMTLNIETGELISSAQSASIRSLTDKDGHAVAPTDANYIAIAAALAAKKEAGFVLEAYRNNEDRRQRGQLINIRQFAENVVVPWRDPIAAERPAHGSTEQDTADLTALISATRIRIHNEGVTALLDAEDVIKASALAPGEVPNSTEIPVSLGVGRYYVIPTYHHEEMDMLKIVDSLKSSERAADIQAAIVATMRNRLAHVYTNSQYKAAQDALTGGTGSRPKVAVVCDPVVARYIIEPGELRTLVDFEMIVIPILDFRMRGKLRMVFVSDDGGTDVNYLNFGYLFWSPEHVLVANMSRTGAYNRETQVSPRYRFYVACPIMISLDIKNIEAALAKMPINVDSKDRP